MDNTKLAYFAGLIDGEGCICIKRIATFKHRQRSPTYVFSLTVEMTDPRPIHALCKFFNMSKMYKTDRSLKRPTYRHSYAAHVGGKRGISILKQLLPFFLSKKEEAQVAIKFYERTILAHDHLAKGFNRKTLPLSVRNKRHSYYLRLQQLKTRRFPITK